MIAMTLAEIARGRRRARCTATRTSLVTGAAFRRPPRAGRRRAVRRDRGRAGRRPRLRRGGGGSAARPRVLGTRRPRSRRSWSTTSVVALGRLARHVVDRVRPDRARADRLAGQDRHQGLPRPGARGRRPDGGDAGNLNNEIGVPLTVLRCTAETAYLVVEMGARGIGHIAELCRIAPPDVAAVLNVGTAHLGEFGSREAIAQAKGEIVEALGRRRAPPCSTPTTTWSRRCATATPAHVLTFGAARADVRRRRGTWTSTTSADPSFALGHGARVARRRASAQSRRPPGRQRHRRRRHGARRRASTCARVARALSEAAPASRWRMELHERADGLVVVNDAYNANPASMARRARRAGRDRRAAAARVRSRCSARCSSSAPAHDAATHEGVGRYAAERGVDVVVAVGEAAAGDRGAARGAVPAGRARRSPRRAVTRHWPGCARMSRPRRRRSSSRPSRGARSSRPCAERLLRVRRPRPTEEGSR